MIACGVKKEEYREIKDWIVSRLHGKTYEAVEFSNGYGAHVPKVTVEYLGWGTGIGRAEWGATPMKPTIIIRLGRVLSRQNTEIVPLARPSVHFAVIRQGAQWPIYHTGVWRKNPTCKLILKNRTRSSQIPAEARCTCCHWPNVEVTQTPTP